MRGNMEGAVEGTADDYYDHEEYIERRRRNAADDLVLIARFALLDPDGHPVTHICGVPIEEVKKRAEAYAGGTNMGSNLGHRFPW